MIVGPTFACGLKLFWNTIALGKDEEEVSFINMRINALWEGPDQDKEVRAKHIVDTERFQLTSREPIPPLARELIDLDNEVIEDPMVACLIGEDTNA